MTLPRASSIPGPPSTGTWLRRVADAIVPPWMEDATYLRLARMAYRVRLLVAVSAIATAWFLPNATHAQRITLVLLVSLVYLPYTLVLMWLVRRTQGRAIRLATFAGDLAIVFLFQASIPQVRFVALFGYLLILAYYVYAGGLVAGAVVGTAALALTFAADMIGHPVIENDLYTISMFTVVMVSLAVLLDAVTKEQRAATRRLQQLHDSLRAVSSSLEVRDMLDCVAASAKDSLGGAFAAILLRESDDLLAASLQGIEETTEAPTWSREAMRTPDAGPSAMALSTGGPVVVQDFASDERFSRWIAVVDQLGVAAMVAAPMMAEGRAIGVLNVYLEKPNSIRPEAVELAAAFAQQAAGAIARGLAYERERAAAGRLRELDRLKAEFVATVSHELRTPLTSIQGFTETLQRMWVGVDDPEGQDYLLRISKNASQLGDLIDQLLDLSRIDAEDRRIRPRRLSLRDTIGTCLDMYSPVIGDRTVGILIDPEVEVRADPRAIERIMSNLLSNAAKFSEPSEPLEVGARVERDHAVVWVRDHGAGFPPEESERIFDTFYRASGNGGRVRGAGIGLSVARRFVELLGGRIWAEGRPAEGATFFFTLPLAHWTWRPTDAASEVLEDIHDGPHVALDDPAADDVPAPTAQGAGSGSSSR